MPNLQFGARQKAIPAEKRGLKRKTPRRSGAFNLKQGKLGNCEWLAKPKQLFVHQQNTDSRFVVFSQAFRGFPTWENCK